MLEELLDPKVQEYIQGFTGDITKLAFAGSPFPNIPTQVLLEQISSREQIKTKLPTWYKTPNIYYPPKLNLEQTSSEITARHKTKYIQAEHIADLTGGFGIDTYYLAQLAKKLTYFEKDEGLSRIAAHNFRALATHNIEVVKGDSLTSLTGQYDLIYADPARRNLNKKRVFLLSDCLPDIPSNLNKIFAHTDVLVLKTSPMLDITQGLKEFQYVGCIHCVAIENEVKELLWFIYSRPIKDEIRLFTFNYTKDKVQFFESSIEDTSEIEYSTPLTYLYEPNAAILKSGGFNILARDYSIKKLAPHSHLYTSDKKIEFPGRSFKIMKYVSYNKQQMKALKNKKANVSMRNFTESVAQIRKKWKIKEGGLDYLFFTRTEKNSHIVIFCKKIETR